MHASLHCLIGLFLASVVFTASGAHAGESDATYSEATSIEIKASNPILHGLEIQSMVDEKRHYLMLSGPDCFSMPKTATDQGPTSYLSWYRVRKPDWESKKEVSLATTDQDRVQAFRLGKPRFFLMPAQLLATGRPQDVPERLNHFLVFETVTESDQPTSLIGVPAAEWHHDEQFPIKSKDSWLIITPETAGASEKDSLSMLDQFGLNKLSLGKQSYRVKLARPISN